MTVERTSNGTYTDGLRFYRPHPYLLVTEGSDGIKSQIVYLPDKSQEYVVRQNVGIGSSDLSLTLENGWNLTALGHKLDTKVPETLTALAGLAKLGAAADIPPGTKSTPSAKIGLYRVIFNDEGGVTGLKRVGP